MRPIVSPRFYPSTRAVAWIVLLAMLLAVLYTAWISLANWRAISV
jgi:hypothetical protein